MVKLKSSYILLIAAVILMTLDLGVDAKRKNTSRRKNSGSSTHRRTSSSSHSNTSHSRSKPNTSVHSNSDHRGSSHSNTNDKDTTHINPSHRSTSNTSPTRGNERGIKNNEISSHTESHGQSRKHYTPTTSYEPSAPPLNQQISAPLAPLTNSHNYHQTVSSHHYQSPPMHVHVPTGGKYVPNASALPTNVIYVQQQPSGHIRDTDDEIEFVRAMYREYRREQRREERLRRRHRGNTSTTSTTTPSPTTAPNITNAVPDEAPHGIICVPIKVREIDPQNPAINIEVERTICYPAQAPPQQANGNTNIMPFHAPVIEPSEPATAIHAQPPYEYTKLMPFNAPAVQAIAHATT